MYMRDHSSVAGRLSAEVESERKKQSAENGNTPKIRVIREKQEHADAPLLVQSSDSSRTEGRAEWRSGRFAWRRPVSGGIQAGKMASQRACGGGAGSPLRVELARSSKRFG
jgi:hypothetical protein